MALAIGKAKIEEKKAVYIHNDLSGAALYFKNAIDEKLKGGNRDGIGFDCMACAVLTAFTIEAKINFLGHKLVKDWDEWQSFGKKLKQVLDHLGVNPDWSKRPYSSIDRLKKFRDSVAHGKPVEIQASGEAPTLDEAIKANDLSGEWEAMCNEGPVFEAIDDEDAIWKELLEKSGLDVWETITTGSLSVTTLEKIVAK